MKSKALNVAVASLLWVAGLGAPFSHFHHGDSDHAHPTSFTHAHLGHPADHDADHDEGPSFDHPDDGASAVWEDWSGIVSAKASVHVAILTDRVTVGPCTDERRFASPFVLRTHDPPDLSNTSARAPPTV
jgi:hypothetical protein